MRYNTINVVSTRGHAKANLKHETDTQNHAPFDAYHPGLYAQLR